MKDPYKALGVSKKASDGEIKKAYRRLAKEYHPDRTGGDKAKESRFKDISAAYEILSDSDKRAQFDNMAMGGGIPHGANLSDIFSQMFGGAAPGRTPGRAPRQASPFGGMGQGPFGGGQFGQSPFGQQPRQRPQPKPAPTVPKERKVQALNGTLLTQRGDNIYSDLRLRFDEAMVGVVANVPTLSGIAKVRVPAGTGSGQKLRLKNKGAPASRPSPKARSKQSHGDHFVTIHIDVPKVATDEGRDLLAKLVKLESVAK